MVLSTKDFGDREFDSIKSGNEASVMLLLLLII